MNDKFLMTIWSTLSVHSLYDSWFEGASSERLIINALACAAMVVAAFKSN